MANIIVVDGFEIEVGSPTYERLLKQRRVTEQPDEPTGDKIRIPLVPDVPLADRKRSELDALAAELGIESPDRLPNKGAVVEAIEDAQGKPAGPRSPTDPDGDPSGETLTT